MDQRATQQFCIAAQIAPPTGADRAAPFSGRDICDNLSHIILRPVKNISETILKQELFKKTLRLRLREARKAWGLKLRELAKATKYSIANISSVENGHFAPGHRFVQAVEDALHLNHEWVMTGEGQMVVFGKVTQVMKEALQMNINGPEFEVVPPDAAGALGRETDVPKSAKPQSSEDFLQLLEQILGGQFSDARQQVKIVAAIVNELKAALKTERGTEKKGVDTFFKSDNSQDVRTDLKNLMERVKALTRKQGSKGKLAKAIGISASSLSLYLAGAHEPGGEITLTLYDWVLRCERNQKGSPADACCIGGVATQQEEKTENETKKGNKKVFGKASSAKRNTDGTKARAVAATRSG